MREVNNEIYLATEQDMVFKSYLGNCYPSDPSRRLPIEFVDHDRGEHWYCVKYDRALRRRGFNPVRKKQVAMVGDSFTFGIVVRETDTLGYLLNEKYPEVNYQNWGKVAADIDDVAKICDEIVKSVTQVDEVIYLIDITMSLCVRIKE